MRIFFCTLRLTAVAAMVLVLAHRASASAVCIVMSNESAQYNETVEGFKKQLTQQGFAAETQIHVLSRDGSLPQDIARSVGQAKPAYLLVLGSPAAQLAGQGHFGIPMIAGLVFSGADLAGMVNTTGVYLDVSVDVQLSLIKRLFPKARRVGVVYSMENGKKIAEASKIAPKYGLELEAQEAYAPKDIPPALESAGKKADVLWGLMDKVVLTPETAKQILLFSMRNEVPFIGPSENWAKAGAAAAITWNFEDLGMQCAEILLKLHKGAKVAEVGPVGPRKIEYALNLKAADQLKIEFGPDIVNGSKRVFKGE